MPKQSTWKTTDLPLAAYLVLLGYSVKELLPVEGRRSTRYFVFDVIGDLEREVDRYYKDVTISVHPAEYAGCYRKCKDMIHNSLNNG